MVYVAYLMHIHTNLHTYIQTHILIILRIILGKYKIRLSVKALSDNLGVICLFSYGDNPLFSIILASSQLFCLSLHITYILLSLPKTPPQYDSFILSWFLQTFQAVYLQYTWGLGAKSHRWKGTCGIYLSGSGLPHLVGSFLCPSIYILISWYHFSLQLDSIGLSHFPSPFISCETFMTQLPHSLAYAQQTCHPAS